jgi:sulfatase maturation enzyme AslB (radical SAM superfamily)
MPLARGSAQEAYLAEPPTAASVRYCSPTGIAPVLQVHPTRRCNIACAHCYTASGPTVREELDPGTLLAAVEDAAALGYRQLAVSGGEPLLSRHLAPLLSHARALGMLTTVTTNGMLLTVRRWEPLAPLVDVLAVSIDGTPEEHDTMRRCDGAFARTVANLAVVRSSGIPFGIIFTLTFHNVDSLEFVVRLAADQGARSVQVHPLTLEGRAAATLPGARPDQIELMAALGEAGRLGDAYGVQVQVDAATVEQLRRYRACVVPEQPVTRLVDVAPLLVVEAGGLVVPLTHGVAANFRLGSLAESPLSVLAGRWLTAGLGDALASACRRAWDGLTSLSPLAAVYWYDEVAATSHAT